MLPALYKALRHIRLDTLTTRHIQAFISNLGENDIRERGGHATAKIDLSALLKELHTTQKDFAVFDGVGCSIISSTCKGKPIALGTAQNNANALKKDVSAIFSVDASAGQLSPMSIRNYHTFVSSTLGYAVHMGMIKSNPAANAALPSFAESILRGVI